MRDIIEEVTQKIATQHRKIIDDWCAAYLAKEYELGNDIHPGSFVIEQSPLQFDQHEFGYKYKIVKEELVTRKVDEWHRLSVKKPALYESVLIWSKGMSVTGAYLTETGKWAVIDWDEYEQYLHLDDVEYWKKAPNPPQNNDLNHPTEKRLEKEKC